jgi:tetrahydromethanopterin S-methyltransferase subunit H
MKMRKYDLTQKTFQIGNINIGGQPGEWPTVMCGSIFYGGHKIVSDQKAGIFDKTAALDLLKREKELCETFGMQRLIDVVGDTSEALIRYVDFVLEYTDAPLLVDSAGIKQIADTFAYFMNEEARSRMVYSPIDHNHVFEDYERIKELKVKNALIMAFTAQAVLPEQKFELLLGKNWKEALKNGNYNEGLLADTINAGVENILIDVGVIDMQGTAWSAIAIDQIKTKLGYPAGCAPANALFSWMRRNRDRLPEKNQISAVGSSVYASTIYSGANFVLYGPINQAEWAYPACAATDALNSYGARLYGTRAKTRTHPIQNLK